MIQLIYVKYLLHVRYYPTFWDYTYKADLVFAPKLLIILLKEIDF